MAETAKTPDIWVETERFACEVRDMARAVGLPYLAIQSDFGNPDPMRNWDGKPFAVTHFEWLEPLFRYWEDRSAALHSPFMRASRLISEPFYYSGHALKTWRESALLADIDCSRMRGTQRDYEAIITPVHMARGVIGTVIWAGWPVGGVAAIFAERAAAMQAAALRFLSSYAEATGAAQPEPNTLELTRREAQCLKWAAAGKTDFEIGIIMSLSLSTVRFHLRNASEKLGTLGRIGAVQKALGLGFVGAHETRRRSPPPSAS